MEEQMMHYTMYLRDDHDRILYMDLNDFWKECKQCNEHNRSYSKRLRITTITLRIYVYTLFVYISELHCLCGLVSYG